MKHSSEVDAVPTDLWNEDGDRLWLRYDLAATASRARTIAWRGTGLPTGFRECGPWFFAKDLTVKVVYCRPAEIDENNCNQWTDDLWYQCEKDHPNAAKFWEVHA